MSASRQSCAASYITPKDWSRGPRPPGSFTVRDAPMGRVLEGVLPCGDLVVLPLRPYAGSGASWEFNDNLERPNLMPSVLYRIATKESDYSALKERWHGWLRNGEWVSC